MPNDLEAKPQERQPIRERPKIVTGDDGEPRIEMTSAKVLSDLYGVRTNDMANGLTVTAVEALGSAFECLRPMMFALAAELEPRDAVEAMLIVQMGATHAAMTGMSKKVVNAGSIQLRESCERSMTRLSRTYLAQMDALKKYRAKAQQTVRVERVTVENGGQAIVGAVQKKGDI